MLTEPCLAPRLEAPDEVSSCQDRQQLSISLWCAHCRWNYEHEQNTHMAAVAIKDLLYGVTEKHRLEAVRELLTGAGLRAELYPVMGTLTVRA